GDRRQPPAQLGQRPGLDPVDQASDDVVEQRDLLARESIGRAEEQVGDAAQRLGAALGRAALDRILEIDDQRIARSHAGSIRALPTPDVYLSVGFTLIGKIGSSREQLVWPARSRRNSSLLERAERVFHRRKELLGRKRLVQPTERLGLVAAVAGGGGRR